MTTTTTGTTATMSTSPTHLTLTYLDLVGGGSAESTRLALQWGNVAFDDIRLSYEAVAALRNEGKLPCGQVPILTVTATTTTTTTKNDSTTPASCTRTYGQSGACLRYAGTLSGLYPTEYILDIEQILGLVTDIQMVLLPLWYTSSIPARNPYTGQLLDGDCKFSETQMQATRQTLQTIVLPARLQQLENIIASYYPTSNANNNETNKSESMNKFLFGSNVVTIADLQVYTLIRGFLDGTACPQGIDGPALLSFQRDTEQTANHEDKIDNDDDKAAAAATTKTTVRYPFITMVHQSVQHALQQRKIRVTTP